MVAGVLGSGPISFFSNLVEASRIRSGCAHTACSTFHVVESLLSLLSFLLIFFNHLVLIWFSTSALIFFLFNEWCDCCRQSVHYCDFLHLETTDPLQVAPDTLSTYLGSLRSPIHRLPRCSFHTVVFSLLLEYLPSPYQRWLCCTKAHELLQHNGLLVIVTPDSHR